MERAGKRNKSPSLVAHGAVKVKTYFLYLYLCRLFGQKKEDSVLLHRGWYSWGVLSLDMVLPDIFFSFSLWNMRESCTLDHPVSFDFPAKKTGCLCTLMERTGLCEA